MFDVITIGGATQDIIFVTSQGKILETPQDPTRQRMLAFEYAAKIKSKEIYFTLGGGAANIAVGLRRLGLKTAACLNLGKDSDGLDILDNLKKEKVSTRLTSQKGKLRTAFSFIAVDQSSKEHVIFAYPGANTDFKIGARKGALAKTDWIYLTSLAGNWQKELKIISQVVEKNQIKLAFNPGGEQIKQGYRQLDGILKLTTLLALNKDEAIELVLLGKKRKVYKTSQLIKILLSWGPEIVVITEGKKGATVGQGKNIYQASALPGERIDTTGAGDSFGSGFLSGLIISKGDIKQALKYGISSSNFVVRDYGAQTNLPSKKKIKKKVNSVKVITIKR